MIKAKLTAAEKARANEGFDFGPADADPISVPGVQTYVCADCQGPIQAGQPECAGCSTKLNWEGFL